MTMPGLAAPLTTATRTTPTIDATTLRQSGHDTGLIRYQGRTILAGNLTR
jgi:hypothetical protein